MRRGGTAIPNRGAAKGYRGPERRRRSSCWCVDRAFSAVCGARSRTRSADRAAMPVGGKHAPGTTAATLPAPRVATCQLSCSRRRGRCGGRSGSRCVVTSAEVPRVLCGSPSYGQWSTVVVRDSKEAVAACAGVGTRAAGAPCDSCRRTGTAVAAGLAPRCWRSRMGMARLTSALTYAAPPRSGALGASLRRREVTSSRWCPRRTNTVVEPRSPYHSVEGSAASPRSV